MNCLTHPNGFITQQYLVLFCRVSLATRILLQCRQKNSSQTVELDPVYQLIYDTQSMKTPDSNQQRVRILLWLKRMNCNISQLQKLDDLRKIAAEKYASLQEARTSRSAAGARIIYTIIQSALGFDAYRSRSK